MLAPFLVDTFPEVHNASVPLITYHPELHHLGFIDKHTPFKPLLSVAEFWQHLLFPMGLDLLAAATIIGTFISIIPYISIIP